MDFERPVGAMSLVCGSVELHLVVVPLVVNFTKDELQQFPKCLGFLETLIACNVIVATAEHE